MRRFVADKPRNTLAEVARLGEDDALGDRVAKHVGRTESHPRRRFADGDSCDAA